MVQRPQGKLMRDRRDLAALRIDFRVDLRHTPLCKQRKHAPSRLGFQVVNGSDHEGLTVVSVMEFGNYDTAVVQHNQDKKAKGERNHTVRPGDRVTALNGEPVAHKMLKEIEKNTTPTDTSPISFMVQRELDDLLEKPKERSPSSIPRLHKSQTGFIRKRRPLHTLSAPASPSTSVDNMPGLQWNRFSSKWPAQKPDCPHHKPDFQEAVPMGRVSSLAWTRRERSRSAP
jgi:hypothetical protein